MINLWKRNQKEARNPITAKLSRIFEPLKDEVMKVNIIILAELYVHKLELNGSAFIAMTLVVILIILFSGFRMVKGNEKGG